MKAKLLLLSLFICGILHQFISNERPLFLLYQNNIYFPIIKNVTQESLGLHGSYFIDFKNQNTLAHITKEGLILFPPLKFSNNTVDKPFLAPSFDHVFGTNSFGLDIFSIAFASLLNIFIMLFFGFLTSIIAIFLGSLIYLSKLYDLLLQRLYEICLGIPLLYLILLISGLIEINIFIFGSILSLFSWTLFIPYIRLQTLQIAQEHYIEALEFINLNKTTILVRHILPNLFIVCKPFIPFMSINFIVFSVGFDFLNGNNNFSIGSLINEGIHYLDYPWIAFSPSFILIIILLSLVFAFNNVEDLK